MTRFYNHGWFHKLAALVIASGYFILLIFINNSTYVWVTLALVFVLFVTTFTCASRDSPAALQLRGTRLGGINNRTNSENHEDGEESESTPSGEARIWMTDVPPSYAYVMELGPPTPPPSYGSAILMFPPPYSSGKNSPQGQQRLRPLSISTQVSMCGSVPNTPQPGGRVTFSTQISVVEPLADTVSLRTRLFLSRQVSREGVEDPEEVGSTDTRQLRARHYLSRQASREDVAGEAEAGGKTSDVYADTLQLRTRLFLSRQASRENVDQLEEAGGGQSLDGREDYFAERLQLRTQLLLSRQISREGHPDDEELQTIDIHSCQIPILLLTDESGSTATPIQESEEKKVN